MALHLRLICDTNEKFNSWAIEYKNYLIARDYKRSIVSKHFAHVLSLSSEQAHLKSTNRKSLVRKSIKRIMKYNPGFLTIIVCLKNIFLYCIQNPL